jgi:hypothetical protein
MPRLPHKHGYPGTGMHYVICAVCGKKVRYKDTTMSMNRYNSQYRLLVCLEDADKDNPQAEPLHIKADRQSPPARQIGSEQTDQFVSVLDPSGIGD